ncbi:hypothetical protein HWV62_25436 [Athelia sp. TMB]|nr:hypothetical protein HWV62_25436 [Athelia sp. TMB]
MPQYSLSRSAAQRLPCEIITMIMHLALVDGEPENSASLTYIAANQRLVLSSSQLCRVWRAAVTQQAALWVFWSCTPSERAIKYYRDVISTRCESHPLHVSIRVRNKSNLNQAVMHAVGNLLAQYAHGLKAFEVSFWPNCTHIFPVLFPSLLFLHQQKLGALSFQNLGQQQSSTFDVALYQAFDSSLRHLKLQGADVLRFVNFSQLQSLVLSSGSQKTNKIGIVNLLEALDGLHNLESLSYIGTPIYFPAGHHASSYALLLSPDSLPYLRHLSITGLQNCPNYFRQLIDSLPPYVVKGVRVLELELGKELVHLVAFLKQRGPTARYRAITLRVAKPDSGNIHNFLHLLPAIESSDLKITASSAVLFVRFKPPSPEHPNVLPSLLTLELVFASIGHFHLFLRAALEKPGKSGLRTTDIRLTRRDLDMMEREKFCDLPLAGAQDNCGRKGKPHGHFEVREGYQRLCILLHPRKK